MMKTPIHLPALDTHPLDQLARRCEELFRQQQDAERRMETAHAELMEHAEAAPSADDLATIHRSYRAAQADLYMAQLAYERAMDTLKAAVADACERRR